MVLCRLFADHAYVQLDPIRAKVWGHAEVEWWYRQNIFLYVRQSSLSEFPKLAAEYHATTKRPSKCLAIVNEEILNAHLERAL